MHENIQKHESNTKGLITEVREGVIIVSRPFAENQTGKSDDWQC